MDVLIVLVFVSILLVCAALVLFFVSLRQRDFEHSERLSLLPLTEPSGDTSRAADAPRTSPPEEDAGLPARKEP